MIGEDGDQPGVVGSDPEARDGSFVLTDVEFARMLAFQGRFLLEINGMTSRTPTLKNYNLTYGTNFSRKAEALYHVESRIRLAKAAAGFGE